MKYKAEDIIGWAGVILLLVGLSILEFNIWKYIIVKSDINEIAICLFFHGIVACMVASEISKYKKTNK